MALALNLNEELASPRGNCQNRLRVSSSDREERARCTAWLLSSLLPSLERAHGDSQQVGKLRLRQASGLSGFCGRRDHNLAFACLHVFE